jgi:hypothetical protein
MYFDEMNIRVFISYAAVRLRRVEMRRTGVLEPCETGKKELVEV